MGLSAGWLVMSIWDAIRHHNACPLVPFWLPGVALDLILDALDLILEALDFILEALDFILEALGDILGMAWILSWPGDPEWGWIALRLEREQCFARSRDPGHGPSGG